LTIEITFYSRTALVCVSHDKTLNECLYVTDVYVDVI